MSKQTKLKVGLLTYHRNYNYGWNLQCWALLTVLKELGYEPTLIDKRLFYRYRINKNDFKFILKKICGLKAKNPYEYRIETVGKNVIPFFDAYLNPRTMPIFSSKELHDLDLFDAYVVGSDQLWRSKWVNPIEAYFLNFVRHPCIKLSYAASFGNSKFEYTPRQINSCKKLIESFNAVSLRETDGIDVIRHYKWNINPIVMPDPTLLLSKNQYLNGIDLCKYDDEAKNQIFAYILDDSEDKQKALHIIEDKLKLESSIFHFYPKRGDSVQPLEKWLASFKNAKFVFTDSFHGCVFALIFRKPFIVYGNAMRGLSRFTTLLTTFDESSRLIFSSQDIKPDCYKLMISLDETKVNEKQEALMWKGRHFLKSNIG